jgi:hypothetical protein
LFGAAAILLAILAQYIHESLSLVVSVAQAVCCAPVFGMFLLGMLSQRADAFDAIVGLVASLAFIAYLLAGSAVCTDASPSKPCANGTEHHFVMPAACHHVLLVARLSQWLYAAVGSAVCFFAGMLSSLVRGQVRERRTHAPHALSHSHAPHALSHSHARISPPRLAPSILACHLYGLRTRSLARANGMHGAQVPPVSKIVGFTWWTRTISMRGGDMSTVDSSYGIAPHDPTEEKALLPARASVGRVN